MEYLVSIGISKEVLDELKEDLTKGEIESINNCLDRLESSILYLREIGVKNSVIEEIILLDYHVLMPGRKYLEIALSKIQDVNYFVAALNENIEYVEYLRNIS